ncbi:mandelate racemase/muconate lactonizing enzyme family protein [Acidobacteria bacterium AH-259-L09]|nr:mandelate racemase/muconate lactonizing enzyme family protein [Acidobacteria bacterium AH-259-L09]
MKITKIDTSLYRFPAHRKIVDAIQEFTHMEVIAATVYTDEGTSGMGYSYTIGRGGRATKVLLDSEVVPLILGEDPADIERLWEKMWWSLHWVGRQGLVSLAMAAMDIALWDLKAKHAGLPLYKLLGAARDKMPVYDTDCGWLNHSQEELVREASVLVQQGFTGIKIKVGKEKRSEDVERLRAVRKAIGQDTKLMVDANLRWSAGEAIARARLFEEFDLFWLEEPIEADDVLGHEKLRQRTSIPIAVGESLYNRHVFKEYLARGAATILQPDVGRVGGVTEWLRIAHMAHSFNVSVSPHFLMELHIHLACALPNALWVEHIPFLNRFVQEPLSVEEGYAFPPNRPGHGVLFNQQKSEPHLVETNSWPCL